MANVKQNLNVEFVGVNSGTATSTDKSVARGLELNAIKYSQLVVSNMGSADGSYAKSSRQGTVDATDMNNIMFVEDTANNMYFAELAGVKYLVAKNSASGNFALMTVATYPEDFVTNDLLPVDTSNSSFSTLATGEIDLDGGKAPETGADVTYTKLIPNAATTVAPFVDPNVTVVGGTPEDVVHGLDTLLIDATVMLADGTPQPMSWKRKDVNTITLNMPNDESGVTVSVRSNAS